MKQAKRILIMGLPGAGKTYLAERLKAQLEASGKTVGWLNADAVRAPIVTGKQIGRAHV